MPVRPLLFDSSVLIPMIRMGIYEDLFQRALRSGRARLSSVVMQELYAGAQTPADKRDYDGINRAFLVRLCRTLTMQAEQSLRFGLYRLDPQTEQV